MTTTKAPRTKARAGKPRAQAGAMSAPFAGTVAIAGQLDALRHAFEAGVLSKAEHDAKCRPLIEKLHASAQADEARMRELGPLGVTIGTTVVVTGEPIETAWGNQVRADLLALNAGKAELSGATFTGAVLGISPTAAGHLTRKDYVDNADALKLNLTGGTVTGQISGITPTAAAHLARKDYIDNIDAANNAAILLRALKSGDTFSGNVQIGGDAETRVAGIDLRADGVFVNAITNTGGGTSTTGNITMHREGLSAGQPGDVGGVYVYIRRANTSIGSITIAAGPTTAYNTTSDPRLKEGAKPITNAVRDLRKMAPIRGRFKGDTAEMLMWDAERVLGVMRHGVVTGRPGAKLTAAKARAIGHGAKAGDIDPLMMDYGRTTPLIAAAVLEDADRIDALEARLAKLETRR